MTKNFKIIFIIAVIFFFLPIFTQAVSLGEKEDFFIDSNYDLSQREEISATLQRIGNSAYFYVDNEWWNSLDQFEKTDVKNSLRVLDNEFHSRIYPVLISTFGLEWKPGIDEDMRVTILIHPMKKSAGGYFSPKDEYFKLQLPESNEREMIYLNADYITSSLAKSLLAHEFVHLITFNQKEKIRGVSEEVWLNEARAEYAPTLVDYDNDYKGSNLEKRVEIFLESPSDSISEWQGKKSDYGALNLFIQYLVDHYGIEILSDSLKSKEIGIKSLNESLEKNGFEQDFSQIFTDWTIAVLVNDCSLGERYCYTNENLKNLRVIPSLNFLPIKGESTLGVSQTTKNWTGNWFKFIGGKGILKIEFIGNPENLFRAPCLIKDFSGNYSLNFIQLDEYQRGEISISKFGTDVNSVIIIPTIQSKISGFLNPEPAFPFFWSASITDEKEEENSSKYLEKPIPEMSKKEILSKISEIETLLNQLKTQLDWLNIPAETSCQKFEENLFFGLKSDNRVKCLQEFLKSQGPEIYPEGLVTGNFLSLTRGAVVRFQEKYASEILISWELTKGTGFVGSTTRAKINEILSTSS